MKSPPLLRQKLTADWHKDGHRVERFKQLVEQNMPVELSIGLPKPNEIATQAVRQHLMAWQDWSQQSVGTIIWQSKKYQACHVPIECPKIWQIHHLQDWYAAMDCPDTQAELAYFMDLLAHDYVQTQLSQSDNLTMAQILLLVRYKTWVLLYSIDTVVHILILSTLLHEDCAQGLPLRALHWQKWQTLGQGVMSVAAQRAMSNVQLDTKFFERHQTLLCKLLDLRFQNRVSAVGLAAFLGAEQHSGWLRLHESHQPLKWLHFAHIRVLATDLSADVIPFPKILIVENEQCLHLLPPLPETLVIAGTGQNLSWLQSSGWRDKQLFYWGDLDSWGLAMLANAQQYQAHIVPVMMDRATLLQHQAHSVIEPNSYRQTPIGLTAEQQQLFTELQSQSIRLEQEFLDKEWVARECARVGLCEK